MKRPSERGEGKLLDQFNNPDNPYAHYTTTGPEIWRQTSGRITHFVSSMGTTGTITGVSRFLREQEKPVTIVGLQPEEGSSIPGIRRWPAEYMPGIFNASLVDEVLDIHQNDAENTMRELAVREGIFCGVSSGGAVAGALRVGRFTMCASALPPPFIIKARLLFLLLYLFLAKRHVMLAAFYQPG